MRCGFVSSANRMQFQFAFRGGSTPINTRLIVCDICLDDLDNQQSLLVIPPDPPAMFNTNPENYAVDETNWLATSDGDILTTESDIPITTNIPNPDDDANTTLLLSSISYPAGSVVAVYLDILNSGVSVLEQITGSATRTNVGPDLETGADNIAVNTDTITVTSSCENTVNASHVALYSAATAGTLLASGSLGTEPLTIVKGFVIQFNAQGLTVDLN